MNLSIISTGGTIISKYYKTKSIRPSKDQQEVIKYILESKPYNYPDIQTSIISPFTLLSENITISDYLILAHSIEKEVKRGADAIIVTHGTDTITYTIAAISLLFKDISIPILFTGSSYPYNHPKSNATMNIWNSILFAHRIDTPGVYLSFGTDKKNNICHLFWGARATCFRVYPNIFASIDGNYIASIMGTKFSTNNSYIKKINNDICKEKSKNHYFSPDVLLFEVYPSFNPSQFLRLIGSNTKAVLLELYHSGTASVRDENDSNKSLCDVIRILTANNIPIFGHPVPVKKSLRYKSTTALINNGLIPIGIMSTEMALTKLRWLLEQNISFDMLKSVINRPFVAEMLS